jgi:hypothetical protein
MSPHTQPFQACVPRTQTVANDYLACMMWAMDTAFLHPLPETNSVTDQTLFLLFLPGILKQEKQTSGTILQKVFLYTVQKFTHYNVHHNKTTDNILF